MILFLPATYFRFPPMKQTLNEKKVIEELYYMILDSKKQSIGTQSYEKEQSQKMLFIGSVWGQVNLELKCRQSQMPRDHV